MSYGIYLCARAQTRLRLLSWGQPAAWPGAEPEASIVPVSTVAWASTSASCEVWPWIAGRHRSSDGWFPGHAFYSHSHCDSHCDSRCDSRCSWQELGGSLRFRAFLAPFGLGDSSGAGSSRHARPGLSCLSSRK